MNLEYVSKSLSQKQGMRKVWPRSTGWTSIVGVAGILAEFAMRVDVSGQNVLVDEAIGVAL